MNAETELKDPIYEKVFKDPIYGYIKIPSNVVNDIIDTPIFQRLRRITQTSFSPLYPSSNHNRFEHSIGVYTLGKIAGDSLTREIKEKVVPSRTVDWDRINEIFSLACLLHDVGHAPFSHTGEDSYLAKTGKPYKALHEKLFELVGNNDFKKNVSKVLAADVKPAAAHEIMSAIVGIQNFSQHFDDSFEKEFFARCITGYKFSKNDEQYHLYNCYIALLNSKVLDVDRLDYLIRDAFFTGFDTVNLDYQRLLSHITVTNNYKSDNKYQLAFYKGAISVIENFVYAHDSERKWIQNQPTILYDMYIIQYVISQLNKKFSTDNKKLFSYESINEIGQILNNGLKVSLLCDDDIISLMKTHCLCEDNLCREYFSRQDRRHPLWKTEAEYNAFFLKKIGPEVLDDLKDAMKATEVYLRNNSDEWIIKNDTITKIETDLATIRDKLNANNGSNIVLQNRLKKYENEREKVYKVMKCLQTCSTDCGMTCDFVILNTNHFYSGFNTVDFSQINIVFPSKSGEVVRKFDDAVTSLRGKDKPSASFFYIFYKRSTSNKFEKEVIRDALSNTFFNNSA